MRVCKRTINWGLFQFNLRTCFETALFGWESSAVRLFLLGPQKTLFYFQFHSHMLGTSFDIIYSQKSLIVQELILCFTEIHGLTLFKNSTIYQSDNKKFRNHRTDKQEFQCKTQTLPCLVLIAYKAHG